MKPRRGSLEPFYLTGSLLPAGMIYTLEWRGDVLLYGGYPYRFGSSTSAHDHKHVLIRTREVKHWSAAEQIRKHFEKTYHYSAILDTNRKGTPRMNARMSKEALVKAHPLLACGNVLEFKQRMQWLSEGMLRNHILCVVDYKVNTDEIAAYQSYKNYETERKNGQLLNCTGSDTGGRSMLCTLGQVNVLS